MSSEIKEVFKCSGDHRSGNCKLCLSKTAEVFKDAGIDKTMDERCMICTDIIRKRKNLKNLISI